MPRAPGLGAAAIRELVGVGVACAGHDEEPREGRPPVQYRKLGSVLLQLYGLSDALWIGDAHAYTVRHVLQRDEVDTDGALHAAKVAWRALAQLEMLLEG
jgi:hypothetical protein